jgi:hypothetical protein
MHIKLFFLGGGGFRTGKDEGYLQVITYLQNTKCRVRTQAGPEKAESWLWQQDKFVDSALWLYRQEREIVFKTWALTGVDVHFWGISLAAKCKVFNTPYIITTGRFSISLTRHWKKIACIDATQCRNLHLLNKDLVFYKLCTWQAQRRKLSFSLPKNCVNDGEMVRSISEL